MHKTNVYIVILTSVTLTDEVKKLSLPQSDCAILLVKCWNLDNYCTIWTRSCAIAEGQRGMLISRNFGNTKHPFWKRLQSTKDL